MHNTFVSIVIVIAYISIFLEIVLFSVSSVASTYQLFIPDEMNIETTGLLGKILKLSPAKKFIVLCLPDFLGMIAFFIPLVLVLSPGFVRYLSPLNLPAMDYVRVVGVLLLIAGRVVSLSAVPMIKGKNGEINTDVSLITGGVFAWSRNPIASGMLLTFLGFVFIVPSFILFAGFLIYAANMHFRILLEEDFMRSRYGYRYEEYFLRVRRYL